MDWKKFHQEYQSLLKESLKEFCEEANAALNSSTKEEREKEFSFVVQKMDLNFRQCKCYFSWDVLHYWTNNEEAIKNDIMENPENYIIDVCDDIEEHPGLIIHFRNSADKRLSIIKKMQENNSRTMTPFHVSYNVAHQLRYLGFHYKCNAHYNISNKRIFTNYPAEDFNDEEGGDYFISAPTLEQVHRWMREEKGIALNIIAYNGGKYHWREVFLPNFKGKGFHWYDYNPHPLVGSYEEALTNGIEWALHAIIASGWKYIPPEGNNN